MNTKNQVRGNRSQNSPRKQLKKWVVKGKTRMMYVWLPAELLAMVDQAAKGDGISRDAFINRALAAFLPILERGRGVRPAAVAPEPSVNGTPVAVKPSVESDLTERERLSRSHIELASTVAKTIALLRLLTMELMGHLDASDVRLAGTVARGCVEMAAAAEDALAKVSGEAWEEHDLVLNAAFQEGGAQ